MKIISWNLNGLLATMKAGSLQQLNELQPDIICFQEIRTKKEPVILDSYTHFWNHGEREGYSGTAILSALQYGKCSMAFSVNIRTKRAG